MPRKCAYCNSAGRLTREHVWPNGIIKRVPKYRTRYTSRGNRVIGGEFTIADVCAACNNGPLAKLDAYICEMYDRYFHEFHDRGAVIEFEYDWHRLGNWLLKVSYNSARASGNQREIQVLSQFSDSICGIDTRQPDLAVFVDLTEPSYLAKQGKAGLYVATKIRPEMTRLASLSIPDTVLEHYILRLVAMNSFYFYLAIPVRPYMAPHLPELIRICKFFALMTTIDPERVKVICTSTGLSVENLIIPHMILHQDAYRQYLAGLHTDA